MDLLPCPFCGHPASEPHKLNPTGKPTWQINCGEFCISMRRGSRKEVIQDWNTRTVTVISRSTQDWVVSEAH